MRKAHIIGCSADTLAVIMDMLQEVKNIEHFLIYQNIETGVKLNLPHKVYSYEIFSPGINPTKNDEVFWGLAGPSNKKTVLNYFVQNHAIIRSQIGSIIHPHSYISSSSCIDAGVIIEPSVTISAQANIGFGVFIKRGALIGHHNHIGAFTDINPGVVISGKVVIGSGCTIGSGSVISDNVEIGENSLIGVGSVVTKNIPSGVIAYGNPCKVIRENDKWIF